MTTSTGRVPVENLERHLAPERLRPYRAAAGGALAHAIRLYEWNSQASGSMYEILGNVEVLLRNALDRQLQQRHDRSGHTGDWWDDPAGELEHLYTLRNRIVHHEPIHRIDLAAYETDAVFVVGCIDPGLADWLRSTSRLTEVLAQRPAP